MGKEKIDELEKRKRQLEKELEEIQNVLDDSIIQVRSDLGSHLDPRKLIKKFPLPAVGASILLGFLAGHKRSKSSSGSGSGRGEVSGALISEIKKLVTRKALTLGAEYLENIINEKKSRHRTEE